MSAGPLLWECFPLCLEQSSKANQNVYVKMESERRNIRTCTSFETIPSYFCFKIYIYISVLLLWKSYFYPKIEHILIAQQCLLWRRFMILSSRQGLGALICSPSSLLSCMAPLQHRSENQAWKFPQVVEWPFTPLGLEFHVFFWQVSLFCHPLILKLERNGMEVHIANIRGFWKFPFYGTWVYKNSSLSVVFLWLRGQ